MSVNPIIASSPIILFLGAGASAPLEKPMMAEFVEKLEKTVSNEEQKALLTYLVAFKGADLEAIIGELDVIIGLDYANSIHGVIQPNQSFTLYRSTAQYLRTTIRHAVIKEYRNVDENKVVEIYDPLFEELFSRIDPGLNCLTIFTTNYDPAIEEFCKQKYDDYRLCDGFAYNPADRHNYWSRSIFDTFKLELAKRNIVLFKLHGSVDWLHVKANNRIRRGQAMFAAIDSDAYNNVLIYPATRKIATDEPYYSAYEYYQNCCETAKMCLAIGYSFRDYDALTRLRGAFSRNENLQLLLLAPRADEVLNTVPIPPDHKTSVQQTFGPTGDVLGYMPPLKDYLANFFQ